MQGARRGWGWAALIGLLALLVPPGIVATASGAGAAQVPTTKGLAQNEQTLQGTYRTLAVAPLPGGKALKHDIDTLEVGDRHYELVLPSATRPPSGTQVRVTGQLTGVPGSIGLEIVVVSTITPVPGAPVSLDNPSTGVTKVLVVLAQWTAPDSVTTASANTQIFTDDNNWFQEASFGQLSLTGSVTPWVSIPAPPTPCDTAHIMTQARSAANTAGFNPATFDRVMVYFPRTTDCDFGGLASVGGGTIWVNGSMDRRITVHEQGHNYGLFHAHSYTCRDDASNQVVLADPTACTTDEYGDPFDAMGSSNLVGHFSASQKAELNWFGTKLATLASGGSAVLKPYATSTTGTLAAKIDVTANRSYWLEYRTAAGFDSALPSGATSGVLVHFKDPSVVNGGSELIDQRPAASVSFLDASLPFGSTWESPDNWRITVGSPDANGVQVSAVLALNDAFASSKMVTGISGQAPDVNSSTATKEPGEPNHAGNAGGKSVWYRWTAPASGTVTIDTAGSSFDTLLGAYTGTAVNALTQVAANDNVGGGNLTSTVTFAAIGGTTYRIAVDGSGGASGTARVHWNLIIPPPPNDAFANAQALSGTVGQATDVNTTSATKQAGEPNHAGNAGGKSAWYRWTAPAGGPTTFETAGSNFDTLLAVYTGATVGGLSVVGSNDDVGGGSLTSRVTFTAVAGTVYQIAGDGYDGASGVLKVRWSSPPPNDAFAGAQLLTGAAGQVATASNIGASKEAGEPNHAGNAGGASVWYRWTAPASGQTVIDTAGSSLDTLLAVYTGAAVNALTQIAANDDDPGGGTLTSKVTFTAVGGTVYRIAVDGYGGETDFFSLHWAGPAGAGAIAGDYDGDHDTDLAVFRPSAGVWFLRTTPPASPAWGTSGDIPVPADYDGDGKVDVAVFRPSTGVWYLGGAVPASIPWGASGDIPVPGDYDGDGKADLAVFRPGTGTWYLRTAVPAAIAWGASGDIPVPADYDGDGKADLAVFRGGTATWYLRTPVPQSVVWGAGGDIPVPADYDGDGSADLGVFRPGSNVWFLRTAVPTSVAWGAAGDIPSPGDYDGDGKADRAVFRPSSSVWYVQGSTAGPSATPFGASGDLPLSLPSAIARFFFSPPF